MQSLTTADLKGKRVLYRPDYNVPIKDGTIQDDFRIQATFPTLDYLMEHGAKIIIATHLGRPDGHRIEEFELRPVAERLADQYPHRTIQLAHEIHHPDVQKAINRMSPGDILILPNVRFYPQEEENNTAFVHQLTDLGDIYVNDAFACDHRGHASIIGPPKFLPSYPGFLLEKEVENLSKLLAHPEKPFIVVMGGAKVSEKINTIRTLAKVADKILVGGAMVNTFLLAKKEEISNSKAEPEKVHLAEQLIDELGENLILAKDFLKDEMEDGTFRYLDIGEQSIEDFKAALADAKTIFWNGSLGYAEDSRFARATQEIAEYIGNMKGVTSVIAGGDTVETITRLKLHDNFTFISTGGGAALEFLAGEKLPGVEALENSLQE